MKKINLIEWLSRNSHEKQSPQRFARYAAMLIMLLTLGVGQMWGYNASNTDVYFDNTNAAWDYSTTNNDYIYCLIGRDHDWGSGNGVYSQGLKLSPIANTQLFHKHIDTWNNYDSFCFFHTDNSDWGDATSGNDNNSSPDTRRTYGAGYTNEYNIDMSQAYIFTAASASNNANLSLATFTTYEGINKTQTIQVRISEDNGSTYSDAANFAAWPGSITVARTYLSAADASSSPATTAMTSSTTIGALTSSITFTGTNTTEYTFAGWSNTTSSPDGNTSKTYTITDASTTYAFYKRNQYTVSYGVYNSANGSVSLNSGSAVTSSSSSTLNHGTAISFTATPNSGYQVEGWYSDAACSSNKKLQPGGTSYNAGTLTAGITVYVKFEVRTGGTVTLTAGTGGQVSLDNSSWGTNKTKSDITTNTAFNIYAQANTGYTFSAWENTGSGYITSTSSASTSFTPVAYEDATVTASFSENTVTVSPTCAYDHGNPRYSNPTASNSGTVGIVSTSELVAPNAGEGYEFAGWTLSNNLVVTAGDEDTDQTITVRTNGDGNAVTATANYNEVLTTDWTLKGSFVDDFGTAFDFEKKSGASTSSIGYCTMTLAAETTYSFKVISGGSTWYGNSGTMTSANCTNWTFDSSESKNAGITTTSAGTYVFKVDFSGSKPSVSVIYPPTLTWSANSIYSGSATIAVNVSNVISGKSLKYELFNGTDMSVAAAQTINVTTTGTTHSQSITVTPSFGASDVNKQYTVKVTYEGQYSYYTSVVGRKWDIYVHDVQSWGGVKHHQWGSYGGGTSYPGNACDGYNSAPSWYTVTIDGKCNTGFVLSKSSDGNTKTVDLTPSITTYPAGSYWYIDYVDSKFKLTSVSITTPTVTLSVDESRRNVNQFTVTGTITSFGGDGSSASGLKRVGFYLNDGSTTTQHTAVYASSGTTFTTTFTGLTANKTYAVEAFATNVSAEGKSSAEDVTTLADATYKVQLQVLHGANAPHVYAWTPGDSYGAELFANVANFDDAPEMTKSFEATTYDWYEYDMNNKFERFVFYETGSTNQTNDFIADRASDCYWYRSGESKQEDRGGKLAKCPIFTTNIVINDGSEENEYVMTGTGTMSVTKTLTAGTYYIKALYNTEYYGKGADYANTIARTGNTTSNAINDVVVNGGYITLTADFDGTYTFSFDEIGKDLSVTYPTAYTVTYSKSIIGTDNSTTATPTATYNSGATSVTSTHYVPASTSVTFDAKTAGSGYTWKGWYKIADPSADYGANKVSGDANCSVSITKDTTIYAVYEEGIHTVSVVANDGYGNSHGSVSVDKVNVGIATVSEEITATPENKAWRFKHWVIAPGISAADGYDTHSNPLKINATSDDITLIAYFEPRYALMGSLAEDGDPAGGMPYPTWNDGAAADFEVFGFDAVDKEDGVDLRCTRTLEPNKTYKFQVYDREIKTLDAENYHTRLGLSSATVLPAGDSRELTVVNGSGDVRIQTVGRGNYTFKITKLSSDATYNRPTITVERPSSHLVSIGQGYVDIDDVAHSNSTTGGTLSAEATESGTTIAITNGKYIANDGRVDWTVDPADGYTLDKYYGYADFSDGGFTFTYIDPVNDPVNVYAKFVETSTAVTISHNTHGHVTVGGVTATSTTVGITTTRALVAVPDAGYYFAGWTVPDGADFELQDKSETEDAEVTLHGLGAGTAGTLIANFVEEDKIYFRNIDQSTGNKLWDKDNIYVYFATTWYDGKGVQTLSNYAEMSPAFDTKIYWAYVPHAFTKSGNTHVAFSDVDMHTNSEFYNNHGVYRTDYNKALNMFVPNRTSSGPTNGTVYHSNGYWKVYNPKVGVGQGYYLQLHTGDDGKGLGTYTEKGQFTAVADGSSKISYTMRVDNTSTQTQYRIASAGGVHYTANAIITTAARENVTVNEYKNCDNCYFTVTLTSEGDYTFILDQSEDYMKLTVDYPVSIGDYRLKHTYNDGSDKTTYSDVIKANDASTPHTLSMYLSTEGEESLVLQKCTAIEDGVPVWDEGDDTNLGGILTTVGSNPGVYQFDVSVSADKVAEAPTATLYTGPYYIKTDGATGGWVNYTQNSMTENTLNFDAEYPEKSFNYYYCKYYNRDGYNLKCVIANDYCNALTDTLIGDDVLGELDAKPRQTTPSAVSVRFSYNSYTNEIKRSYLGASTTDDFLRVLGNTTASAKHIYDKDESTFDDSHADSYIKFEDKQNWRYEIDVKADVNARAKLTATFNGQTQYFMGQAGETGQEWDDKNTEQLFGGASGTYALTLVYDFKTNKLIRAWKPTGSTISENLTLKSDVLLLREHQEAPAAITFGTIGETDVYASLAEVKTVYSVLRLNRWRLNNRAHPEDTNSDHCNSSSAIATHHPELTVNQDDERGKWLPQAERELYFISFPYDVKMSDIISFGDYYDTWGIMYYDGKNRAKNGYWIDSESNWKYFTPEEFATGTLNAYEGYLIGIDLAAMRYDNTSFWTNNSSEVDIYFPSKEPVSTITQQAVDVPIDQTGYQCTINREFGGRDGDRRIKDSYWHCIGVPAYANLDHAITGSEPTSWENTSLLYLYEWNTATNDHSIRAADNFNFQAMYAYLVQYAGTTLSWSAAAAGPAPTPVAARRMKTEELRDRQFNLQLMQGGKEADHTYIRLSDDEEVTTGFEFNHDVSKMMLNGANIYTLIGKEQAAANSLPLDFEQTTVVPVGVKIATAGDYTFAIPEGTDGVGVVLIDNIAGTRTNLALTDYEVSLTSGKIEDRFVLEISPISQISTDVETISEQHSDVRKVMVDGMLYIVKDGKVFDAQGKRVQ